MLDSKILRLLKKGTKQPLSGTEREQLRNNGILWEQQPLTHEALIAEIRSAAEKIPLEKAVKGFLYSISSGDYRYRTALSSLIWAKALEAHDYIPDKSWRYSHICAVCGAVLSEETYLTAFSETEYHRIRLIPEKKFIDICEAGYVLCDLQYFAALPEVNWCEEDLRILNRIFGLIPELASGNKVNALLRLIAAEQTLSLTAADAYSILGVLSSCGVFDTPHYKSCRSGFVNWCDRGFVYETDIYYPLLHWRGRHGVNYEAIGQVFGPEIAQRLSPKTAIPGAPSRKTEPPKKPSPAAAYFRDGKYTITLDDRFRHYYGLQPLDPSWDTVTLYSMALKLPRRMVLFYEGNTIRKFIYEELRACPHYIECDTDAETDNRTLLLPKTSKGRPKPITPSQLLTPTYMNSQLLVTLGEKCRITAFNNCNYLPLPPADFTTDVEFDAYTERYIASCPPEYEEVLHRFRTMQRTTVKFTAGNIFRMQLTPTLYTYCLILGKIRQLLKWQEIPEKHPFQYVMLQPIAYRQYALITEDPNLTAEDLQNIPLLPMQLAQDIEILRGTYPIVASKQLTETDIDLGFSVSIPLKSVVWNLTMHDFGEVYDEMLGDMQGSQAGIGSSVFNKMFKTYGVSMSIRAEKNNLTPGIIPLPEQTPLKERVIDYLKLDPEAPEDDFAVRYGGLTRKEFITLAEQRFKK